jgi:NTE family protein
LGGRDTAPCPPSWSGHAPGEVFAFTPQRFDDICSDLSRLPISVGVAASAAFPVALSPMSLLNYSYEGCPAVLAQPQWVRNALTKPLPRYIDLENYKQARYANALCNGPDHYRNEHYIHLLDGGLADNQGVHSLTQALISSRSELDTLGAITSGRAKRIAVIAVNARSDADSSVGSDKAVPGLLKVVNTVISTPIDATTSYANASLQELVSTLKSAGQTALVAPGRPLFGGLRVYGIPIDFDQLRSDQAGYQATLKNIGTRWTLSPEELQQTLQAGRLLLRQHPCYQRLLLDISSPNLAVSPAQAQHDCPFEDDSGS